ncbi:MAG: SCO family protein [Gammaproteobacteria bacterium]|nr:SCO family protein [Gammaproteobacteria bacterium]
MPTQALTNRTFVVILLLVSSLAFFAGYELQRSPKNKQLDTQVAEILPKPRTLSNFKLLNHQQQAFNQQSLRDKWSLAFFGYTNCPDICPNTMIVMKQFWKKLSELNIDLDLVQIVFVSVDPKRDTIGLLKDYVSYFNTDFIGVTGDMSEIEKLTQELEILYGYEEADKATGNYIVNHSAQILLLNPAAQLHAILPPPHDAGIITADFITIKSHYEN